MGGEDKEAKVEITYRIGGHPIKLKMLSCGNLFCYPDGDSVFLLTNGNLEAKSEVVDIETGIRYKYDAELDVIKVVGKIEISPQN